MKSVELIHRPELPKDSKIEKAYNQIGKLVDELVSKDIDGHIMNSINQEIVELNAVSDQDDNLLKQIRKKQNKIIKIAEKELKLVSKNHYRNQWMALGMVVFGLPFGVAFGTSLGNMAFLSIGLPIGMAVGIAIGAGLDKKAYDEGRQLDLELH